MSNDPIIFGTLTEGAGLTNVRTITRSDIRACPFRILMLSHYRADGSCRCTDASHTEMLEWEYVWDASAGRWVAGEDDE